MLGLRRHDARSYFSSRAASPDNGWSEFNGIAHECKKDLSFYYSWLFRLFTREFSEREWNPHLADMRLYNLPRTRSRACSHSLMQKLACSKLALRRPLQAETSTLQKPYFRPQTESRSDVEWLDSIAEPEGRPHYWWDTQERKPIVVADEAPQSPQYVCISHTWGRWRKSREGGTLIPGVPWLVPENTKFDVAGLPKEISCLDSRYVWIDLFCIPQEGSELQKIEIARQATIFRNARDCYAGINDVHDWGSVEVPLEWLGPCYLKSTTRPSVYQIDSELQHTPLMQDSEPSDRTWLFFD